MESKPPVSFVFENVPRAAVDSIMHTLAEHGVASALFDDGESEMCGGFQSEAGAGIFAHDGKRLTVTITRDNGHFSRLMIKGGLRQLVGEAIEAQQC
jgi:hypothetical protein